MKLIYVTLRQSSDWLVCLTCHYVLCCDFFFFFTSHLQLYQWARWAVVRQSISLVASQSRSSLGCFDRSLSGYISQGSQSTQFWCAVWLPSVCVAIISNQIAAVSLNTHTWHRISVGSLTCFPCSHVCSLQTVIVEWWKVSTVVTAILSSFFFCTLPSELPQQNSAKTDHILRSGCNLKMHFWNMGYPLPTQIGGPITTFFDNFAIKRQI